MPRLATVVTQILALSLISKGFSSGRVRASSSATSPATKRPVVYDITLTPERIECLQNCPRTIDQAPACLSHCVDIPPPTNAELIAFGACSSQCGKNGKSLLADPAFASSILAAILPNASSANATTAVDTSNVDVGCVLACSRDWLGVDPSRITMAGPPSPPSAASARAAISKSNTHGSSSMALAVALAVATLWTLT